jgi:hypothetical protein
MSSLDRDAILNKVEPISAIIIIFFIDYYIDILRKNNMKYARIRDLFIKYESATEELSNLEGIVSKMLQDHDSKPLSDTSIETLKNTFLKGKSIYEIFMPYEDVIKLFCQDKNYRVEGTGVNIIIRWD